MFSDKLVLLNWDGIYLINQQQEMTFQKSKTANLCAKERSRSLVKGAV
jgi:hypothetical protein